jgi:two-component system, LytTR family, response regulator
MNISCTSDKLIVNGRRSIYFIHLDLIEFIESVGSEVLIYTDQKEYRVRATLKSLQALLPENMIRVHKSFIINLYKIKEINAINNGIYEAYFSNEEQALIHKRHIPEILSTIK